MTSLCERSVLMIWLVILGLVCAACVSGSIYMTFAVTRFGAVQKIPKEKRWLRLLTSFGCIAAVFALFTVLMSLVNAIIIFLHVILFFLLFGLIFKIVRKVSGKSFKINWQGWLALLATAVYMSVGYYLCNHVWQTDYSLSTDKQVGTLKVAVFSDSHIGTTFDGNGLAEHIRQIEKQSPDILLIPGDFVDDGTNREDMINACKALGSADIKYGVWFAYGNHDKGYYGSERRGFSAEEFESELEKNGVHILKDGFELIDDRFYIVGRNDKSDPDRTDMTELVKELDLDKYIIVMDHQPNDYDNESKAPVDLVVSGHTHGGQFFPVTFVGQWFSINDRTYGHEKRNGTDFIVTSGISDWELSFKTGTKSEYVIINIEQN